MKIILNPQSTAKNLNAMDQTKKRYRDVNGEIPTPLLRRMYEKALEQQSWLSPAEFTFEDWLTETGHIEIVDEPINDRLHVAIDYTTEKISVYG